MQQLIMLGTGNAMCTRCYNTCFFLRTPAGGMMVDAGGGNGIFRQLHRARVAFEEVHHLMVTHCHPDHLLGVVWMIRKISPMMNHGRYTGTLTIYGHNEALAALRTICSLVLPRKIFSAVDDTIIFREVKDGETLAVDDMSVTFFDLAAEKMKQFGFQALLPDGQRLVCMGDEPCHERNEHYVAGCDWLLHEAFCLEKDATIFRPHEKSHSTALDVGRLAQQLAVKHLVMYHTEDTHLLSRRLTYTAEAAVYYTGSIHVPDDLETIELTQADDSSIVE